MIVDKNSNKNSLEVTQIAYCDLVQSYIFLGLLISNNGSSVDEVKRRMTITRSEKMGKI